MNKEEILAKSREENKIFQTILITSTLVKVSFFCNWLINARKPNFLDEIKFLDFLHNSHISGYTYMINSIFYHIIVDYLYKNSATWLQFAKRASATQVQLNSLKKQKIRCYIKKHNRMYKNENQTLSVQLFH